MFSMKQCLEIMSRPSSGAGDGGDGTGSRTDPAWQYASAIQGDRKKTQCNFCGKKLQSGGITRLKQHLSGLGKDVSKCPQCPVEISRAIGEQLRGGRQRRAAMEREKQQFEEAIRGTVPESSEEHGAEGWDLEEMTEAEARQMRHAAMASRETFRSDAERRRTGAGTSGAGGSGSGFAEPEPERRSKGIGSWFSRSRSRREEPVPRGRDEVLEQDPAVFQKRGSMQK